jgi:DNA-binding transcriptional LysR family regulator
MLSLNELSAFIAAATYGSFSEAGRQLHLSQPAISQTIDNLEKRFGSKLFVRQGRSVKLTEAGQVLKPMACELMASARRVDETMASLQGEVVGEMTIGCSTASGKYLLPGMIARFRRQYPLVRINVIVSSRESVIKKLLSGEVAFSVSSKLIEHSELEYQVFFEDEVILVVPNTHPWVRYRKIYPDDLLDEPIILREEAAGSREILFNGLHANDILPDMLNVAMILGNAEGIVMAVEEGIGVAFVSRLSATRSLELGRLVEIGVHGLELNKTIRIARNRRLPASRAQIEFWSSIKDRIDQSLSCQPST